VRSLCDERGLAVLWTTHLVEELSSSDRAVLLQQGAIKDQGVLSELVARHDVHDTNALVLGLLGGQA